MFSAPILASVASFAIPVAAEIDCGPLALRVGTAFKCRVVVESATGKRMETGIGVTAAANLDDIAESIFFCLGGMEKTTVRRKGVLVTVTELDGFPVRKVTFEFNDGGPKPIVRWVPKRK